MALLHKEEASEEWRRRIFAEAEQLRKRGPSMDEVLEMARRLRESIPVGTVMTDSVELLREDRER